MFVWTDRDLNAEQELAIKTDGSVFLTACPGSGKTKTLTYKIAYELSRLKSNKQRVAAITYTHRAADEIHERIENLGIDTSKLWIGTIHSFCLEWILKPYSIYHSKLNRGFSIISSHDKEKLLEQICQSNRSLGVTSWDCEFYFNKDRCIPSRAGTHNLGSVKKILKQYFKTLSENRQIDFELMLYYAHELVASHPSISLLLSNLFSFIMVDEFQDTKEIQYSVIASILKAGGGQTKTFIVGDPNQAIFESMGGFPIAAEDFKTMAGIELQELKLSKNYRSSKRIIEYFSNFHAYSTAIEAASDDKTYPSLISFNNAVSHAALDEELIKLIRLNIKTGGVAPHEICVLAPQWVHLAAITRKLVVSLPEYNFRGPGLVPFSRDIDNFWYKLSRIVLTTASPSMYVRRLRWAGEVLKELEDVGVSVSELPKKLLLRHCNSIEITETDGLAYLTEFFHTLFSRLGIDFYSIPYLKGHFDAFFESSQSRINRLRREGAEFISKIDAFKKVFENRSGITVSTIHGVKGDEYDVVIAFALLEGILPHNNDTSPDTAKKLLYVICSRARKNLHLISERERFRWSVEYQTTNELAACKFIYNTLP